MGKQYMTYFDLRHLGITLDDLRAEGYDVCRLPNWPYHLVTKLNYVTRVYLFGDIVEKAELTDNRPQHKFNQLIRRLGDQHRNSIERKMK